LTDILAFSQLTLPPSSSVTSLDFEPADGPEWRQVREDTGVPIMRGGSYFESLIGSLFPQYATPLFEEVYDDMGLRCARATVRRG
jgi:hypothetical protein